MQFHHNITQHNMSLDQVKFHHRNSEHHSNHSHPTQNEIDTKTEISLRIILLLFFLFN